MSKGVILSSRHPGSRGVLLAAAVFATACAKTSSPSSAPLPASSRWFATWTSSQLAGPNRPPPDSVDRTPTWVNRTVREIVHVSLGGDHVRIRLSNEYGDRPLVIGAAHVARRDSGSAIIASTDRALSFGGRASVTIGAGGVVVSDPVAFDLPALSDLAVSLHVADSARVVTRHALALQTGYVARGDATAAREFPRDTTINVWPFLASVDVTNPAATGVIVTIGNSITDGAASTPNTNRRWPDELGRRLLRSSEPPKGVVNAGISGNRVLSPGAGPSALSRFDRDVLMVPGVTHVVILEGINDIGGSERPPRMSAEDLIFGLRQLADRAHERGLVVIGATLTPAGPRAAFTPVHEAKRAAVNAWIRTSGVFDALIDFDAVTRDPANPTQFLRAYDSGDHLHPGDAGYDAMGKAIDLALFRIVRR